MFNIQNFKLSKNKLTFEMRRWVISQQRGAFFTRGRWVFVCRCCSAPFFPVFHDMSKRQFCMIFHGFHHKKLGVEINERVQQNLRGMGTQLFGFLGKKYIKIILSTTRKIILKSMPGFYDLFQKSKETNLKFEAFKFLPEIGLQ